MQLRGREAEKQGRAAVKLNAGAYCLAPQAPFSPDAGRVRGGPTGALAGVEEE